MADDAQRLADADACHDHEPMRAAGLLRDIAPSALPPDERPLYAFLLNHVLGESLGDWGDAHRLVCALLSAAGEAAPAVLWRQAAAAATLAGDDAAAESACAGLARVAAVGLEQARELAHLAAATFGVTKADAAAAGELARSALLPMQAPRWQRANALDAAAAACCNNLAASLSERPPADLKSPALREATMSAALCSQRLWQRAGDWIHHERACYGVAVAAGAAAEGWQQHDAAAQGLQLLDRHDAAGEQNVDRAFLELELAHALRRLGQHEAAAASRARADALAAAFTDESLTDWYRARLDRQRQLLSG
jgi:hypothetical protein